MFYQKKIKIFFFWFCLFLCFAHNSFARTLIDMRGKKVEVPDKITKIATLSDGFVENILTSLGKIEFVNTIGSWGLIRDYIYTFPKKDGEEYTYKGVNTMRYLHPWLSELVCVNSPQGNAINYEALAANKPDVVIMRVGDCTVRADNKGATQETIEKIEALNIPLVVLYTPAFDEHYTLETMATEAKVIGSIFGEKEAQQALDILDYTESIEEMIYERVKDIDEEERKTVLYFGLNPKVRETGGAGNVHGTNTPQSYMLEKLILAKNAYQGLGTNVPVSPEQVYSFNPDVILLPTMNGYHPAEELYSAPYYNLLQHLRAVKNKQVYALPWTPMNCAPRLEYPLELLIMAKVIYPEKFKDIHIADFALGFYKKVYHVNDAQAQGLLKAQILEWTKEL